MRSEKRLSRRLAICAAGVLSIAPMAAHAQVPRAVDDDVSLNLAEPDFTTINLPTTLRLPRLGSAFRVTHRFTRSLSDGSFSQLASELFGIDNGAQIGLEYRIGIARGVQAGVYRTSAGKTIQFFGQWGAVRQRQAMPVAVSVNASIEGINNFHKGSAVDKEDNEYATALGVVVSRTAGDRAGFYVNPSFVVHSNVYSTAGCLEHLAHGHVFPDCAAATTTGIESNTFLVGLSARVRATPSLYLVGSWTPRASGYAPGVSLKTFGVEKRVGGHSFQLNFSNSLGSTMAQHARGASNNSDWFMGFNISRKFF